MISYSLVKLSSAPSRHIAKTLTYEEFLSNYQVSTWSKILFLHIRNLEESYPDKSIMMKDLIETTGWSSTTVQRVINELRTFKWIETSKGGCKGLNIETIYCDWPTPAVTKPLGS